MCASASGSLPSHPPRNHNHIGLALLLVVERCVTHKLTHLSCRQRCLLILLGTGASSQPLLVRLHLCCYDARDLPIRMKSIAADLFEFLNLLHEDISKESHTPFVPFGALCTFPWPWAKPPVQASRHLRRVVVKPAAPQKPWEAKSSTLPGYDIVAFN